MVLCSFYHHCPPHLLCQLFFQRHAALAAMARTLLLATPCMNRHRCQLLLYYPSYMETPHVPSLAQLTLGATSRTDPSGRRLATPHPPLDTSSWHSLVCPLAPPLCLISNTTLFSRPGRPLYPFMMADQLSSAYPRSHVKD